MAARVLCAMAAVLVGGPAKGVDLKERNVSHTEELLSRGFFRRLQLARIRSPIEERQRTAAVVLSSCNAIRKFGTYSRVGGGRALAEWLIVHAEAKRRPRCVH